MIEMKVKVFNLGKREAVSKFVLITFGPGSAAAPLRVARGTVLLVSPPSTLENMPCSCVSLDRG